MRELVEDLGDTVEVIGIDDVVSYHFHDESQQPHPAMPLHDQTLDGQVDTSGGLTLLFHSPPAETPCPNILRFAATDRDAGMREAIFLRAFEGLHVHYGNAELMGRWKVVSQKLPDRLWPSRYVEAGPDVLLCWLLYGSWNVTPEDLAIVETVMPLVQTAFSAERAPLKFALLQAKRIHILTACKRLEEALAASEILAAVKAAHPAELAGIYCDPGRLNYEVGLKSGNFTQAFEGVVAFAELAEKGKGFREFIYHGIAEKYMELGRRYSDRLCLQRAVTYYKLSLEYLCSEPQTNRILSECRAGLIEAEALLVAMATRG